MRNTLIFAGSSCPALAGQICENLGMLPAPAELTQFSNGETSVRILQSVREKDVFVVQSGSPTMNDTVMELLIMISACKGGSATKITAVLPYLPYSRQAKKKKHRGAITARLFANLLDVAGVEHIISVDLHASQMQGFFKCPIDNLSAEPLLARWIRQHVIDWREGVVVSKNAGGSKRVTSLADALKLSFGIITTDRRRCTLLSGIMPASTIMSRDSVVDHLVPITDGHCCAIPCQVVDEDRKIDISSAKCLEEVPLSPDMDPPQTSVETSVLAVGTTFYNDHLVHDVTHGRLIHGRIVDDNFPSANISQFTEDPMATSYDSCFDVQGDLLGGSENAAEISDEDALQDPSVEHMITLVGDVKNRPVFIVDDMIDKPQSWIAAAETVVKRGNAKKVFCMATHGVFGGDCLQQLQACESIHAIVVTNSIPVEAIASSNNINKLVVLDLSFLLSEAIRRNHHGESISPLFQHVNS